MARGRLVGFPLMATPLVDVEIRRSDILSILSGTAPPLIRVMAFSTVDIF